MELESRKENRKKYVKQKKTLKRLRKERKTSRIERKTNQDITTPEGKTEEKKISCIAEFQKKRKKLSDVAAICMINKICAGENYSQETLVKNSRTTYQ